MNPTTQTFILGITGIVATLISSGLGLYFTARSRTAPLRNHLYSKQIDLIVEVFRAIGRIRIYMTIIVAPEVDEHQAQALNDLRGKVSELSQLVDSATALFPTDLYVEINQLSSVVADFLVNFNTEHDTTGFLEDIVGRTTKMALL